MLLLFSLVVSVAIKGDCAPVLAEDSLQAIRRTANKSSPCLEWGSLWSLLIPLTVNCACHDYADTDA